jgi:hypothetical protein
MQVVGDVFQVGCAAAKLKVGDEHVRRGGLQAAGCRPEYIV